MRAALVVATVAADGLLVAAAEVGVLEEVTDGPDVAVVDVDLVADGAVVVVVEEVVGVVDVAGAVVVVVDNVVTGAEAVVVVVVAVGVHAFNVV